jgi:hypothetical protein
MAGLDPAIHDLKTFDETVDHRDIGELQQRRSSNG